ncbi:hypothetical protein ACQ4PT_044253 [Festuca glaucescens]
MEEAGAQPPPAAPSSEAGPPLMASSSETVPPQVAPIPGAPEVGAKHPDGSADHDRAGASGHYEFEHDLGNRFDGLNLCGEEETDLDFSGEIDDLVGDVRWLAIFRVYTTKPFSHAAMFKKMRNAWAAAQDVTFKTKGANLFLAQFHCLGDWNRVMEGGPWLFRGCAVVLAEYDGFSNVEDYKLDKLPVWARVQGIPDGLMKKKELAERVAKKVGEPPFTVIVTEGKINPSKYLRARVFLDLNKPRVRVVTITLKERKMYSVYYEKLPNFCFFVARWDMRLLNVVMGFTQKMIANGGTI